MDFRAFLLEDVDFDGYDKFLLCLTYHSLLYCLPEIEEALQKGPRQGKILIDHLLTTGNCHNRFLECDFKDGKLDFSSAKNVSPNPNFRQLTVNLLRRKPEAFENSILTRAQKEKVREGIAF